MTVDEAGALVRLRCEQRLGHLGEIRMLVDPWNLGIGLRLPDGRQAAVTCDPDEAIADPVGMADEMADQLLEWQSAP